MRACADAAAPVRRWQRVQWQYPADTSGSETSKRTPPHRQPPVRGRVTRRNLTVVSVLPLVQASYEAFNRDDLEGALGMMSDDIEWHQAQGLPHGGDYHGLA